MFMKLNTMRLQRILLLILGFGFSFTGMQAQTHQCGTDHTPEFMKQLEANVKYSNEHIETRMVMDKRYVPVKFHLIADSDGNGRIPEHIVYKQLCRLNTQYDTMGFVFYVDDGFNYVDNSIIYNHSAGAQSQMNGIRNQYNQSVNVFLPNQTFGTNTAGYYTPSFDYLVVRKASFDEEANRTFGHELGHYFRLAHPHVGWEDRPYKPSAHGTIVTLTSVGSSQSATIPVELMNEVNCTTAGDRICDTPPDYGFTQNANWTDNDDDDTPQICFNPWEGEVMDRNEVLIFSLSNLVMGYNGGCSTNTFTHGQANAMRADYDNRTNIDKVYMPDTTEITEVITTIEPTAFSTAEFYNNVTLSWNGVEGAHGYIVTLTGTEDFQYETDQTEITVTDLSPAASYAWSVSPINEIGSCADLPAGVLFFTSNDEVSSVNEVDFVSNFNVHPNPVVNQSFTISFESENQLDANLSVFDITGKAIISNLNQNIRPGTNNIPVQLNNAPTGLYNLLIRTSEGIISEKLLVK